MGLLKNALDRAAREEFPMLVSGIVVARWKEQKFIDCARGSNRLSWPPDDNPFIE